jgi:hypothetical protein
MNCLKLNFELKGRMEMFVIAKDLFVKLSNTTLAHVILGWRVSSFLNHIYITVGVHYYMYPLLVINSGGVQLFVRHG